MGTHATETTTLPKSSKRKTSSHFPNVACDEDVVGLMSRKISDRSQRSSRAVQPALDEDIDQTADNTVWD